MVPAVAMIRGEVCFRTMFSFPKRTLLLRLPVRNMILAGTCSDSPKRLAAYAPVGCRRVPPLPATVRVQRTQSVPCNRADRVEHRQHVLFAGGMMESSARWPHHDPRLQQAIPQAPIFESCSTEFLLLQPQCAPAAQITRPASLARSTNTPCSANRLGVCVFAPGHIKRTSTRGTPSPLAVQVFRPNEE